MKLRITVSTYAILALLVFACKAPADQTAGVSHDPEPYEYALVLHGGAGYMNFESVPEPMQKIFKHALDSALQLGLDVLKEGGASIDAVEVVIRCMEDNPLFNAGKGAVFTSEGKNELDASIMTGNDLNAGAVAGVTDIRHPISAARAVMEQSEHVMLSGHGASVFAEQVGLEIVDPSYFYTERRFESYQKALARDKHGTVGCVALDKTGNLCAGTSTGGMTNKKYGRIGDSPIIGAGTYANNASCGVSATGHGEYFIRWTVAHQISVLMQYKGYDVESAAKEVVENTLADVGGDGGVICLDRFGRPAMVTNTSGMFRAYGNSEGDRVVAIFK
jgi:beta-aspartyl-peptidase (threonine type)